MKAVVDIGSNSIKYLVAKMQRGKIHEVAQNSQVTGLGRGLAHTGELQEDRIRESVRVLEQFSKEFQKIDPQMKIAILATAAVRDAKNAAVFQKEIKRIFQTEAQVIAGHEEARLSMMGASTALPDHTALSETLFLDIGGASTEFGILEPVHQAKSTPLGAVRTHQSLGFSHEAISNSQWEHSKRFIEETIKEELPLEYFENFKKRKTLVAVGGTLVMAAKLSNSTALSEDTYEVNLPVLFQNIELWRNIPESERLKIPNMIAGRADILPSGMLILQKTLEIFDIDQLLVTTRGIRHGYILTS